MSLRMCSPYRLDNSACYYARKRIPQDLQTLAKKTVIKRSLKTKDSQEARRRAPAVIAHIDSEIARLRRSLQLGSSDLPPSDLTVLSQSLAPLGKKFFAMVAKRTFR